MTHIYKDLLIRQEVCRHCVFFKDGRCSLTGARLNVQIYETCPKKFWPKLSNNKPKKKIKLPVLVRRALSATKSFLRWASKGFPKTQAQLVKERLAICQNCDLWDGKALNGTGRCKECGCSTWAKLRMATEKCPLNKWGPAPERNLFSFFG
jgi:hypothetical protein